MRESSRFMGRTLAAVLVAALGALAGCSSGDPSDGEADLGQDLGLAPDLGPAGPSVRPLEIRVPVGRNHFFVSDEAVTWSVGEPTGGSISNDGQYLAPSTPGDYTVVATRASDPSTRTIAKVHVHDLTLEVVAGQPGGLGASDGVGSDARFLGPTCMTYDGSAFVYVCDGARVRRIDVTTQEVVTLAGGDTPGYADATNGSDARFAAPSSIALYSGSLYVAEAANHTIRKIALSPPYPVTTFVGAGGQAGYVNGAGTTARLSNPHDLLVVGTTMYLADTGNQVIRTISLPGGQVNLFTGTPGAKGSQNADGTYAATFSDPVGLTAMGPSYFYVTERSGHTIRQVNISVGYTYAYAGYYNMRGSNGGALTTARFDTPSWITSNGTNTMYVVDAFGLDGITSTPSPQVNLLARGATGPLILLPAAASPETLLVAANGAVRAFQPPTALGPTLFAGRGPAAGYANGFGGLARFNDPVGIAVDGDTAYVADLGNHLIRRVSLSSGRVDDYAGSGATSVTDGDLPNAGFDTPRYAHLVGKILYIADGQSIRKIDTALAAPRVDTLDTGSAPLASANQLTDDGAGMLYVSTGTGVVRLSATGGAPEVVVAEAGLQAEGVVFHAGQLYGTDRNGTIFVFDPMSGMRIRLAGTPGVAGDADGVGDAAAFDDPVAIAVGPDGLLYVADQGNGLIRRVDPQTGAVTTFAGLPGKLAVVPGPLAKAQLNGISRLTIHPDGTLLMTSGAENVVLRLR